MPKAAISPERLGTQDAVEERERGNLQGGNKGVASQTAAVGPVQAGSTAETAQQGENDRIPDILECYLEETYIL